MIQRTTSPPPDGGWGWVVAFCSWANHLLMFGFIVSLSVVYISWLEEFDMDKSTTSWIISVSMSLIFLCGPATSGVVNRFGYRLSATVGGLLASVGLAMSYFATSVFFLIITTGVITGLSFGLIFLSSITTVAIYFDKRRGFATSIGVSGVGIGSFLLPPLMDMLVEHFGWRGALLIFSGLMLHLCVTGMLLRPLTAVADYPEEGALVKENNIGNGPDDDEKENEKQEGDALRGSYDTNIIIPCEVVKTDSVTLPLVARRSYAEKCNLTAGNDHTEGLIIGLYAAKKNKEKTGGTNEEKTVTVTSTLQPMPSHSGDTADGRTGPIINPPSQIHHRSDIDNIIQKRKNSPTSLISRGTTSSMLSSGNGISKLETLQTQTVASGEDARSTSSSPNTEIQTGHSDDDNNILLLLRCSHYLSSWWRNIRSVIHSNMEMLREPSFLIFLFSQFFLTLSLLTPVIYMVDRALHNGITKSQGAWLISCNGVGGVVGRLLTGLLADRYRACQLLFYTTVVVSSGVVTMLSPLCGGSLVLHAAYACVFGLLIGAAATLSIILVVELVGLPRLATALGIVLLFAGIGHLLGPPVAGFVFDITKSYTASYICQGFFLTCSGLLVLPIFRIRKGKSCCCC